MKERSTKRSKGETAREGWGEEGAAGAGQAAASWRSPRDREQAARRQGTKASAHTSAKEASVKSVGV